MYPAAGLHVGNACLDGGYVADISSASGKEYERLTKAFPTMQPLHGLSGHADGSLVSAATVHYKQLLESSAPMRIMTSVISCHLV